MRLLVLPLLGLCSLLGCSTFTGVDDDRDGAPTSSGGSPQSSSGTSAEPSPQDFGNTCQATCNAQGQLARCDGTAEACALGCLPTKPARCGQLDPDGPATPADLQGAGALGDLVLQHVEIHTDTGAIVGADFQRAANSVPTVDQVDAGAAFRIEGDRAVLRARSIELGDGITLRGTRPLMLLAHDVLRVAGAVRVPCGQLGASALGSPHQDPRDGQPGLGLEGGGPGGGGGNQGAGGRGATGAVVGGGGPSLHAAGRGGEALPFEVGALAAGGRGAGSQHAVGGLGAGSLHLAAGKEIVVGRATGDTFVGLVAGGCGATPKPQPPTSQVTYGAGGGAGGTLLLEAPLVRVLAGARLLALGGGGSSAIYPGTDAGWTDTAAPGGRCRAINDSDCSHGGAGSSTASPNGDYGAYSGSPSSTGSTPFHTQGGGGGSGWIVLRSQSGAATLESGVMLAPPPQQTALLPH